MDTRDTGGAVSRDDLDAETVADALDVLADVPEWELAPARWDRVREIMDRLIAAIRAGDLTGCRDAIADLELSGPVRLLRIGSVEATGIPQPVLDLRNTLVRSLRPDRPGSPATPAQPAPRREPGDADRSR